MEEITAVGDAEAIAEADMYQEIYVGIILH